MVDAHICRSLSKMNMCTPKAQRYIYIYILSAPDCSSCPRSSALYHQPLTVCLPFTLLATLRVSPCAFTDLLVNRGRLVLSWLVPGQLVSFLFVSPWTACSVLAGPLTARCIPACQPLMFAPQWYVPARHPLMRHHDSHSVLLLHRAAVLMQAGPAASALDCGPLSTCA